jgi:serine phosphatase RsbU (regulator of sigma subunit)
LKTKNRYNVLIKLVTSIILSLPIIYLVDDYYKKYNVDLEVLNEWSKYKRNIDLDSDGLTENFDLGNIEKDHIYGEIWSNKSLVNVVSQPGNLIKGTLEWNDVDCNGLLDAIFLKTLNDTLFLSSFELDLKSKKNILRNKVNKFIATYNSEKNATECFKHDLIDLDGDGMKEYIFTLSAGAKNRAIYSYNFKTKELLKTNLSFAYFTNFHPIRVNDKTHLVYTSYANCNIPQDKIKLALEKLNIDTTQVDSYQTDCRAYMGFVNEKFENVGSVISKDGFTGMIRTLPFYEAGKLFYFIHESYINQPDSLTVLKVANENLDIVKEKRVDLRLNNEVFNKFNKTIFELANVNNKDVILYTGISDTLFQLNTNLEFVPLVINKEITSEAKIKQFDLDDDGIKENILACKKGLLIYDADFKNYTFASSTSMVKISAAFEKSGSKEERHGYYICGNDQKLFFLSYSKNTYYFVKYLLVVFSVVLIYALLYIIIFFQTKKLEQDNRKLEKLVEARTLEVKQQNISLENKNIEISNQRQILEEKHKEITDSINYAERIQRALLASKKMLDENLNDYFILFKPKDVVSGDFYWAAKTIGSGGEENFVLVTADSTGHGVPGAIMSIVNISSLKEAVVQGIESPDLILNETRRLVIENLKNDGSAEGGKDGMDGSLMSFDFKNSIMTCASANNPIWIIRSTNSNDKELIEIKPDRFPIGKHDNDSKRFTLHAIDLHKGDVIYSLTDGFADQFGGSNGKKFKSKQLQEKLLSMSHEPMEMQKQKLHKEFETWKGNLEQVDDVCLIGIRI